MKPRCMTRRTAAMLSLSAGAATMKKKGERGCDEQGGGKEEKRIRRVDRLRALSLGGRGSFSEGASPRMRGGAGERANKREGGRDVGWGGRMSLKTRNRQKA